MNRYMLSDGEWKLMNLLWDKSPLTIANMVAALKEDTAWTKATINIMLSRLADKGAVRIDAQGKSKQFYPVMEREEAVKQEAKNCIEKIRTGGIGLLVSTRARECELSREEIDELYRILKEGSSHD